jgi:hypothetical protein
MSVDCSEGENVADDNSRYKSGAKRATYTEPVNRACHGGLPVLLPHQAKRGWRFLLVCERGGLNCSMHRAAQKECNHLTVMNPRREGKKDKTDTF